MTDEPPPGAPANDDDRAVPNLPELTVSELSQALRRTVEQTFDRVRVRAEIGRVVLARSGHMYITFKDEAAVLDGVCWRGTVAGLAMQPAEGMEVVVEGRLTTYAARSSYQIVVERMDLAGEGALLRMIEERRKRLAAEGLFDEGRKQPLPWLPAVIGVVTSPTGAVIRDILHRLADRFPRHVLVWPVNVQGERAASEVAAAIAGFNALPPGGRTARPDLLIIARGGGSLEDLMAFNDEAVVRAAAASSIPLISAIGHETDTTLIDYAADRRAPTPSAAAEMAVPVRADLAVRLAEDEARLAGAASRLVARAGRDLAGLARALPAPGRVLDGLVQRLDDLDRRFAGASAAGLQRRAESLAGGDRLLQAAMRRVLQSEKERTARAAGDVQRLWRTAGTALGRHMDRLEERLARGDRLAQSFDPRQVLQRGYTYVSDQAGHVVMSVTGAPVGSGLDIHFADGAAAVRVVATSGKRDGPPPPPTGKPGAARSESTGPKSAARGRQGRLF
ncbi:MAG: exodeoxyribonuclease VII large subunit [Alphaproteobacteria bacterium]